MDIAVAITTNPLTVDLHIWVVGRSDTNVERPNTFDQVREMHFTFGCTHEHDTTEPCIEHDEHSQKQEYIENSREHFDHDA